MIVAEHSRAIFYKSAHLVRNAHAWCICAENAMQSTKSSPILACTWDRCKHKTCVRAPFFGTCLRQQVFQELLHVREHCRPDYDPVGSPFEGSASEDTRAFP